MLIARRSPVSRRALIRGLGGVAIALPFLEAMIPQSLIGSAEAAARTAKAMPKTRFSLLYYPNGLESGAWYPKGPGADYDLTGTSMEPLKRHQKDFLLLGNLSVPMAMYDSAGDHAKAIGCYGTGVRIKKTASDDIQCAISFDQRIANNIGNRTRFPSLELGLDYGRMEGGCDPGYACIYSNNVSWKDASTPAIKEVNPRVVFDRLFGNAAASDHQGEADDQQETYNRSILDYTKASLDEINTQLGKDDIHRVDEYLGSIREIEHRLDAPPSDLKLPKGIVRPTRVPVTFKEHFRMMTDLQALAFQMDATRISSFLLGVEQSRRTYPEIGIPEEHHGLTHHAGNRIKMAKVIAIDTYMAEQFAYYLDKMKSIKENGRPLLDNAIVVLGNGNGTASKHDHDNILCVVAGRGGGQLDPGRYIIYPEGTPVSNLWLSVMDRMETKVDRHGDSTGRLQGLGSSV